MASILTHWACLECSRSTCTTVCSSSRQYPETSHSHWRGLEQHSTGHNRQSDQFYAKKMSGQILTVFLIHAPTFFLRCLWQTDAYLCSQSCEIYSVGPDEFIKIDWFPYMNCNSVKKKCFCMLRLYICSVYLPIQCFRIYHTFSSSPLYPSTSLCSASHWA